MQCLKNLLSCTSPGHTVELRELVDVMGGRQATQGPQQWSGMQNGMKLVSLLWFDVGYFWSGANSVPVEGGKHSVDCNNSGFGLRVQNERVNVRFDSDDVGEKIMEM